MPRSAQHPSPRAGPAPSIDKTLTTPSLPEPPMWWVHADPNPLPGPNDRRSSKSHKPNPKRHRVRTKTGLVPARDSTAPARRQKHARGAAPRRQASCAHVLTESRARCKHRSGHGLVDDRTAPSGAIRQSVTRDLAWLHSCDDGRQRRRLLRSRSPASSLRLPWRRSRSRGLSTPREFCSTNTISSSPASRASLLSQRDRQRGRVAPEQSARPPPQSSSTPPISPTAEATR
jgi:hypothetical protein